MKQGIGNVGRYCYQTCRRCGRYNLCEHNQKDATIAPRNVCTGLGFSGECTHGEHWSCPTEYCRPRYIKEKL